MKKIITLLILLATFSRSALYSQDTCTSTRYYSSGVIPSEFTKYGRIIAGTNTTGGPAVSNNPSQTTNLRAAVDIFRRCWCSSPTAFCSSMSQHEERLQKATTPEHRGKIS